MNKTIYEMIQYHNELIDEFHDFAGVLCDTYADIDDTPANDKYFEVMGKFREEGIFLCCEANEYEINWIMTEDGYVIPSDVMSKEEAEEYRAYHWTYADFED